MTRVTERFSAVLRWNRCRKQRKAAMLFHILVLSLSVVNATFFECGVSHPNDDTSDQSIERRIVGGRNAREGSWPWIAALATRDSRKNASHPEPFFKCGGSLITSQHILTAAHCCETKLYIARLGATYLRSTSSILDVLIHKCEAHPDFAPDRAFNDIAVIILQKKVHFTDNIKPICLPQNKFFRGSSYENMTGVIAGWGDIQYGEGTGHNHLQEIYLPIYNLKECKAMYNKNKTVVTDANICVGSTEGHRDACQGDSGGPLMAKTEFSKSYFLIGIISHGMNCGVYPSVCTNVAHYISWIDSLTRDPRRMALNHGKPHSERKLVTQPSIACSKNISINNEKVPPRKVSGCRYCFRTFLKLILRPYN